MPIPPCLIALSATEWQSKNKQMRLLPHGIRAQMETTYRWRCGVGRGWSLSRCLDPAWTSCTAIFKVPECQRDSKDHRVEMRHTGQTFLLPWKLGWNHFCTSSIDFKWVLKLLTELIDSDVVRVTKITVIRTKCSKHLLVSWNKTMCKCVGDCLNPEQSTMWRLKSSSCHTQICSDSRGVVVV